MVSAASCRYVVDGGAEPLLDTCAKYLVVTSGASDSYKVGAFGDCTACRPSLACCRRYLVAAVAGVTVARGRREAYSGGCRHQGASAMDIAGASSMCLSSHLLHHYAACLEMLQRYKKEVVPNVLYMPRWTSGVE